MEEWRRLRGPDNLDCRHCSVTDSKQEVSDSNDFLPSFSQNRKSPQFFLQFAINTSKPPAPVALQGRHCLSAKPHEYKRSLVWLNWPNPAKPGKTQGEIATTTLQQ